MEWDFKNEPFCLCSKPPSGYLMNSHGFIFKPASNRKSSVFSLFWSRGFSSPRWSVKSRCHLSNGGRFQITEKKNCSRFAEFPLSVFFLLLSDSYFEKPCFSGGEMPARTITLPTPKGGWRCSNQHSILHVLPTLWSGCRTQRSFTCSRPRVLVVQMSPKGLAVRGAGVRPPDSPLTPEIAGTESGQRPVGRVVIQTWKMCRRLCAAPKCWQAEETVSLGCHLPGTPTSPPVGDFSLLCGAFPTQPQPQLCKLYTQKNTHTTINDLWFCCSFKKEGAAKM